MKKTILLLCFAAVLFGGCKKKVDDFAFKGIVCGYIQCTQASASIAEQDFAYVVSLSEPDSVGKEYYGDNQQRYENCVLLYSTRARIYDGDEISGRMYLDEEYSRSYCTYHSHLDLPEGVCTDLD